jgi:hypothetical protein
MLTYNETDISCLLTAFNVIIIGLLCRLSPLNSMRVNRIFEVSINHMGYVIFRVGFLHINRVSLCLSSIKYKMLILN